VLPQYRPFWKRMAELELPLLAHTDPTSKLLNSDSALPTNQ
jgi:hypothetical protein